MSYTLDQFASACHDILKAEPGPMGRGRVRALVEDVLRDERFLAKYLTDTSPERNILYEDPELGFCILAHVYQGARDSSPHDHGPCWAIYGQARGVDAWHLLTVHLRRRGLPAFLSTLA